MRTRYTLINMVVNVGGQLMNQVLLFISRMVFIHYLSAAYLGVNGLFTDVLGILNLAELGIGTAMIYSLYEPAAKNDEHRLAQLMNLYRLLYRIVAVVVLLVGLALMPFLGFFIKDSSGIEHLRLIYLMYVANSVCSYLLSYKNSIYLAYQKAYVRNLWRSSRRGQDSVPNRPHRADRKLYPLSGGAVCDAVHPEHHRIGQGG